MNQVIHSENGYLILWLLSIVMVIGSFFAFKFFVRIVKNFPRRSIKEIQNSSDKIFERYLAEETASEVESQKDEILNRANDDVRATEEDNKFNEVLEIARKYNVGQGEVELMLNLKSRKRGRLMDYSKVIEEIEKGVDVRKVAKKHGIGQGEIELILNLRSMSEKSFMRKLI